MTTTISGSSGIVFPDLTTMQTGQQAVKAWVNFNGTGTVAIRAGYNVASITDNGAGSYTVNFTTAMVDANYSSLGTAAWAPVAYLDSGEVVWEYTKTTTSLGVLVGVPGSYGATAAAYYDNPAVNITIFR
jgi:hypothetical protein